MDSSALSLLPTTTPTNTTTTPRHTFISGLHDELKDCIFLFKQGCRPWSELIDTYAISTPTSLTVAATRIRKNYSYFHINYLAILTISLAISFLYYPLSLLVCLFLVAVWSVYHFLNYYSDDQPPVLPGIFGGLYVILIVIVIWHTGLGYIIMCGVVGGSLVACIHATFRVPEDEHLIQLYHQHSDIHPTGFLSSLSAFTRRVDQVADMS